MTKRPPQPKCREPPKPASNLVLHVKKLGPLSLCWFCLWSLASASAAVPESPAAVYCIMGSYYVMSPPRCAGRHAVLIVKTIAFLAASENPPATSNCHCGCQAVKERESRGAAPLSILKSRFFKFLFQQHFLFHFFLRFISNLFQPSTIRNPSLISADTPSPLFS